MTEEVIKCQKCKKREYEVGITGLEDGQVIHKEYCIRCYNKLHKPRKKLAESEN